MKKPYTTPKVFDLGSVHGLTQGTPEPDKCDGENDTGFPQILSQNFAFDCT